MVLAHLPPALTPLKELAYDVRWICQSECQRLFAEIDPALYRECGENPVELLRELDAEKLRALAADPAFIERMQGVVDARAADLQRPCLSTPVASPERPIAFFCAEFALHEALPVYAGGLGVLAGDYLKEASDRALPVLGVGLFYRRGYFHQRLDTSGWQHEYWTTLRPGHLPIEPVRAADGSQLRVSIPIANTEVVALLWRTQVGRVSLLLLDTDTPENNSVDRFITAQLYIGSRELRLRQYLVLGVGGVRALRALGVEPALFHLNEGHAAFAALELLREQVASGLARADAWSKVRERLVFTTHTPVSAGNESFSEHELCPLLSPMLSALGMSWSELQMAGHNGDPASQMFGMTPLALRSARAANGVSRRHGQVARSMWSQITADGRPVPIDHVTNGVHLPTWMAGPMNELLDRSLGPAWQAHAADTQTWSNLTSIPDEELWAVRRSLRRELVEHVRTRSVADRLDRGESLPYVEAAAKAFDPEVLTIGFARRVASYKRLHLLTWNMTRALSLLSSARPIQVLIAGKAHPRDDGAKHIVKLIFEMKASPIVGARVAFLEDYDMASAARIVAGCDLWINLPRPPLEASGTSGMKAMLNGCLNLSVLDGWWEEAWEPSLGWAIRSEPGPDDPVQDGRDSDQLYDLLEHEIVPMFYQRDAVGIPRDWIRMIKNSMSKLGPRFNASRMLDDYLRGPYTFGSSTR